jgi:hypothetical protein
MFRTLLVLISSYPQLLNDFLNTFNHNYLVFYPLMKSYLCCCGDLHAFLSKVAFQCIHLCLVSNVIVPYFRRNAIWACGNSQLLYSINLDKSYLEIFGIFTSVLGSWKCLLHRERL